MPKITDSDYFLPEVLATEGIKTLSKGTTQPLLISGICKTTNEKSDYVVKFIGGPRMSKRSSCSELISSFIAMELGLKIPGPALIEVTPDFVDTLRGKESYRFASNSIGINFGCRYVAGFWTPTLNQQLSDKLYREAANIFTFDVLISNADRRVDKPNMLTNGEEILIFDHELAFGFVMDLVKNPTPWIITDHELSWIKNHYFYSVLKGNINSFDNFVEGLSVLDENFWDNTHRLIPGNWITDSFSVIRNNLTSLIKNKDYFNQELNRILS